MIKKRKNKKVIVFFCIFVITITLILGWSYSRYTSKTEGTAQATIAIPVVNFAPSETLNIPIDDLEPGVTKEFLFDIVNFKSGIVNAVDMIYKIKLETAGNIPLSFELYKGSSPINILDSNLNSLPQVLIHTMQQTHNYKLVVKWDLADNNYDYANEIDYVRIIINGEQAVGDVVSEFEIDKYYGELLAIADKVEEIKFIEYAGESLTTYGPVEIRGITFSTGWYFLSASLIESKFGIIIDEKRSSGFIVNYATGEVFSIDGMIIGSEPVHSINYTGADGGAIYMAGLATGVDANSQRTDTKFGELNINGGTPTYDAEGGLQLGTQHAAISLDQTKPINQTYSINVTVKGPFNQTAPETFGGTIVAISDLLNSYVSWIRIRDGFLQVLSFTSSYNSNLTGNQKGIGYMSKELPLKYDNGYLNVQVVAQRAGETKVYVDGVLFETFDSGSEIFSYGNCTIGDLRANRGLKYIGYIYNFALYSTLINEDAILYNWNYAKNQLGIS